MIAVVYSGSRFSDWRLADKGRITTGFRMNGINPYLQDERSILQHLHKNTNLINNAEKIRRIYFFGAGSSSKERKDKIKNVLERFFVNARVRVDHDVIASAISTFGDERGIIGIIGSGSNAAYYTGKKIIDNNYGLGYILADEGATNWNSQQLLKHYMTDTLPVYLRDKLEREFNIDKKTILERVYISPQPTNFLNSFTDFVLENKDHLFISQLVKNGLRTFIKTYIKPLMKEYPDSDVNFTGSVAFNYEHLLREVATDEFNISIGTVVKEPIHNLIKYYINKN
jgi:N-acetylglucosamine kinase-like BadF-type ATPase